MLLAKTVPNYRTKPQQLMMALGLGLVLTMGQASDAISILDRALSDVEQGRVSDDAVKDFAGW